MAVPVGSPTTICSHVTRQPRPKRIVISARRRVLRRLIPHAKRPVARALYNRITWRLLVGRDVECNCCETRFRRFRTYVGGDGHRSLACPRCGSLGRHRVDWLYLRTRSDALHGAVRLLHIAPEVCLEAPLRRLPHVSYLSADYDSSLAMDEVDVTNMHYPSDSFDGVICNHVLTVVDDDRRAMRELYRILRPGGWALVQSSVDWSLEHTLDNPSHHGSAEAPGRYEEVMMRNYGRDYEHRLSDSGFQVTASDFVKEISPALQTRLGLDLDETVFFCRKELAAREPGTRAAPS